MSRRLLQLGTLLACFVSISAKAMAGTVGPLQLPAWEVLQFEKKIYWATATSRLTLEKAPDVPENWRLTVDSSIPRNSESVTIDLDAQNGQIVRRDRLSKGFVQQRFKSYDYEPGQVVRERRDPGSGDTSPRSWPLSTRLVLPYPGSADEPLVTDSYVLLLLADELQRRGPGSTMEVLVHTDTNFYRARLTCGAGIAIETNYKVKGAGKVRETRETTGVLIRAEPAGEIDGDYDFTMLGLEGDIIVLFDRDSGLPLQVRGEAPRVGATVVDLKSVTMRSPDRGG